MLWEVYTVNGIQQLVTLDHQQTYPYTNTVHVEVIHVQRLSIDHLTSFAYNAYVLSYSYYLVSYIQEDAVSVVPSKATVPVAHER